MSNLNEIEVVAPGLLTTVQDTGRRGFQRYGVPVCGALDAVSLRIANILVGNPERAAALEITALGPSLRFGAESVFAAVGADFEIAVDGKPAEMQRATRIAAGSTLEIGGAADGLRAYVAIAGGVDVPPVMGSRSTDLKGGFGGFEGRRLAAGDRLPVGDSPHLARLDEAGLPPHISRQPTFGQSFDIRVVLGPQRDAFTDAGIAAMLSSEYTVSLESDRMGCRLEGAAIEHASGPDIVSDGTALGSVQAPGSGQPIVLLADRGTTGGYAKAATVIGPDIGLLAQATAGAKVRFVELSVEQAHEVLREQEAMIREIKARVGVDLSGALAIRSQGEDVVALYADGRPLAAAGIETRRAAKRAVAVTADGETFEFEIETATP